MQSQFRHTPRLRLTTCNPVRTLVALPIAATLVAVYSHELRTFYFKIAPHGSVEGSLSELQVMSTLLVGCRALQGLAAILVGSSALGADAAAGSLLLGVAALALYVVPICLVMFQAEQGNGAAPEQHPAARVLASGQVQVRGGSVGAPPGGPF